MRQSEINVFLAVSTHLEERNVGHLTAHSNVALANQTSRVVNEWTSPSLNLKTLCGLQAFNVFAAVRHRASSNFVSVCRKEDRPMHASQHCTTLRDPQGDLISRLATSNRDFP